MPAKGKKGLMSNKTTSDIPKTPREKLMWIRARKIVAKESGAKSEKGMPWQLVTHIYKAQKNSPKGARGKVASKEDVKKAHYYKNVADYRKPDEKRKRK